MLKTPKSQKAQQLLSQKNRNPSSQSTSSSTTIAQPQAGSQNRRNLSSEQPNAQKQTSRPSTNTRSTNDKHISNRQSEGSNDAVKLHNRFGVFDETDDMEFEETPTRPRAPNSRSISPVHPPKFPVKPYL